MDERLDNVKTELHNYQEIESIKTNPVVKLGIGLMKQYIPILGEIIDCGIDQRLEKKQKEKRNELISIILSDDKLITSEMVNDTEFIINFFKTIEAVDRLTTNDKIVYFGNLIKNGYLNEERIQAYKFEEYFNIINSLSYRQLDGNIKICAVEKSPKSEIYAISNLFF